MGVCLPWGLGVTGRGGDCRCTCDHLLCLGRLRPWLQMCARQFNDAKKRLLSVGLLDHSQPPSPECMRLPCQLECVHYTGPGAPPPPPSSLGAGLQAIASQPHLSIAAIHWNGASKHSAAACQRLGFGYSGARRKACASSFHRQDRRVLAAGRTVAGLKQEWILLDQIVRIKCSIEIGGDWKTGRGKSDRPFQ